MRTAFLITNVGVAPESRLAESHCVILAPSRALLSYLDEVLPDLGVQRLQSSTIDAWLAAYVGLKGSLRPAGDNPGMRQTVLFGRLVESHVQFFVAEVGQRLVEADPPVGEQWHLSRADVVAAYAAIVSRPLVEHRAQLAEALLGTVIQQLALEFPVFRASADRPSPDTDTEYGRAVAATRAILRRWCEQHVPAYNSTEDIYRGAVRAAGLDPTLTVADLPGLALVNLLRTGRTEQAQHLVIDEGQNVTPLAYAVIRRVVPRAGITILGSMAQRDLSGASIRDWTDLETLGYGHFVLRTLRLNYRSTPSIVAVLNAIGARMRPQLAPMEWIERPAEPVFTVGAVDRGDMAQSLAALLTRWKYRTAAVLCADPARSDEAATQLDGLLPADLQVSRLQHSDVYRGGIVVGTREDVAGLEFDAVVILDADEATYPDTPQGAAEMFALASRAQNLLGFVHSGRRSLLLDGLQIAGAES